jgi:NitT/TauT family transport system permease protein
VTSPTLLRIRKSFMALLAVALFWAGWEFYKWVGPERGGSLFGWTILPKTNDRVMPHLHLVVERLADPLQPRDADSEPIWQFLLDGVWYSFRLAFLGFVIGTLVGVGLAVVMSRFSFFRKGLMPYLVVSQTVPLIALAPLVVAWGGELSIGGLQWQKWMSVVLLGAFLSFFPIAVGTLRGLMSPPEAAVELMRSMAAPERAVLTQLRLPAAVPYMAPALRLGAAGSVIGVLVAEISTNLTGGVGRPIIEFARVATNDPTKVYTTLVAAALLGLLMAGLVATVNVALMRHRPKEAMA